MEFDKRKKRKKEKRIVSLENMTIVSNDLLCVVEPPAYYWSFRDIALVLELGILTLNQLYQLDWLDLVRLGSCLDSSETKRTLFQDLWPGFLWDSSARAINDPKGRFLLVETYCWGEENLMRDFNHRFR